MGRTQPSPEGQKYSLSESVALTFDNTKEYSANDSHEKGDFGFSENSYPIRTASVTRRKYVAK